MIKIEKKDPSNCSQEQLDEYPCPCGCKAQWDFGMFLEYSGHEHDEPSIITECGIMVTLNASLDLCTCCYDHNGALLEKWKMISRGGK